MKLLTTFKDQLVGQLISDPAYAACDGVKLLRALWGHGAPLSNLALKTCVRAGLPSVTAAKGLLGKTLKKLTESILSALPNVMVVTTACLVLWTIFAVLGVALFGGKTHQCAYVDALLRKCAPDGC